MIRSPRRYILEKNRNMEIATKDCEFGESLEPLAGLWDLSSKGDAEAGMCISLFYWNRCSEGKESRNMLIIK